MPAATPTVETVIAAIKAEIDAISGIGTVLTGFHTLESDVEFIRNGAYVASGSMDLWFIDLRDADEFEGRAIGETYERYGIEIRYWSLRTNAAGWSKAAREKAESVRDALSGAASIFRIGGQVQLETPETVKIDSHGQVDLRQGDGATQMVYLTVLSMMAEARRWS